MLTTRLRSVSTLSDDERSEEESNGLTLPVSRRIFRQTRYLLQADCPRIPPGGPMVGATVPSVVPSAPRTQPARTTDVRSGGNSEFRTRNSEFGDSLPHPHPLMNRPEVL